MNPAASAQERASASPHQEQNGRNTEKEKEELAKADGTGVLFFLTAEVLERREHHPLRVMPMEEMQDQRDRHRQPRQEKDRRKESHQPRCSLFRR